MQSASFRRDSRGQSVVWNRAARDGALLAGGVCLLVGLPTPWVPLYGFALAAAPVAAVLGWWAGPRVVGGTLREVIVWALLVGGFAAGGGLLIYSVAAMLVSMLPGSGLTQPETPYGYVIHPVLMVAVLGPFLAIPGSVLAAIWAVALRWITRDNAPSAQPAIDRTEGR